VLVHEREACIRRYDGYRLGAGAEHTDRQHSAFEMRTEDRVRLVMPAINETIEVEHRHVARDRVGLRQVVWDGGLR